MTDDRDPKALRRDWMRTSTLEGRVALVAGGGSGIGEAIAHAFAANGVRVIVADLRPDMADGVARAIKAEGGEATAVGMDVCKQEDIDQALAKAESAYGGLDMLVNSAGVIAPQPLVDADLGKWRSSFEVNVEGALMLARSALQLLKASPVASVVNISSLAGGRAYANGGSYGTSKAALIHLSRTMGVEWAEHGVRVNVISPGSVLTPLLLANMTRETQAARAERIPLGRMGAPREIADLAVFLASPMASYITAQEICCDGGLSQALMVQKWQSDS
ncbi:glucose 1-dehydrogenase [Pseudooceanicola sp. 216_PA32_1]|uniref:Glucose 1-dehydrogenase n=1 Tax=Pseudooceanicola pacificus TaxID=2676438 RepID=A0A844W609_9RHOB|nr:SDR family oxidoreductase [Pseudooceanicola pacificus]MWB78164.1 glucose 1-dehydrogenase [Pseudooceanicola pacificus]